MKESKNLLAEAVTAVRGVIGSRRPVVGLILGSGLGDIVEAALDRVEIPYENIPGFHVSNVEGHKGSLAFGEVGGCNAMIMQGRFHYYEGVSMEEIAFPVELMKKLGVESVIITAASGGVNPKFQKGDIMILNDHINFVFRKPAGQSNVGDVAEGKVNLSQAAEFGDLTHVKDVYDNDLKQLAFRVAKANNITLQQGVYLMVQGPSYETKAEVRMVRMLGGDAVGMSTVPEALAANRNNMPVLGITYISNMASGIAPGPLVHAHVIETMDIIREDMLKLITGIIKEIGNKQQNSIQI